MVHLQTKGNGTKSVDPLNKAGPFSEKRNGTESVDPSYKDGPVSDKRKW
jgi:hypothetical protein